MQLPVAADLALVLEQLGVPVSVGTGPGLLRANAQVSPGDVEVLTDDDGVAVHENPVWILFPAGALGDLDAKQSITVESGPLQGTYTIDRHMTIADGSVGQVLAR